jgi:hypothetical protein
MLESNLALTNGQATAANKPMWRRDAGSGLHSAGCEPLTGDMADIYGRVAVTN